MDMIVGMLALAPLIPLILWIGAMSKRDGTPARELHPFTGVLPLAGTRRGRT